MARGFIVPGQIVTGEGALELAQSQLKGLGTKALLVTDQVMLRPGNASKAEKAHRFYMLQFFLAS